MAATSRRTVKRALVALAVAGLAVAWYLFRPELLFITKTVDEALPQAPQSAATTTSAGPTALAQGTFRGLAHDTKGAATVYRLADGTRLLRLTDFETSNGPDVRVYLVAAAGAKDETTVENAGFVVWDR